MRTRDADRRIELAGGDRAGVGIGVEREAVEVDLLDGQRLGSEVDRARPPGQSESPELDVREPSLEVRLDPDVI